ncbi:MAG TPA: ABC transporter permease, partial [Chitinophagaceae bacterium]|nr:ABC transporter permease [Chitinophagaceae bacterium]
MRTLRFLLQKEFKQIFRDPSILRIILVMPVIQLLVLPWAADYEIKKIKLAVVDLDHSEYSRQMVNKITSSGYFVLTDFSSSYASALSAVEKDQADLILQIPANFEKDLVKESEARLFIAINAINGVKANLGGAYLQSIIQDYNREVRLQWIQFPRFSLETQIEVTSSNWFNPLMNYKYFMVPGILVLLLTMVGTNLTAVNIVREKEIGTIEQINVTPIRKY